MTSLYVKTSLFSAYLGWTWLMIKWQWVPSLAFSFSHTTSHFSPTQTTKPYFFYFHTLSVSVSVSLSLSIKAIPFFSKITLPYFPLNSSSSIFYLNRIRTIAYTVATVRRLLKRLRLGILVNHLPIPLLGLVSSSLFLSLSNSPKISPLSVTLASKGFFPLTCVSF